jgi:hypothetical protein
VPLEGNNKKRKILVSTVTPLNNLKEYLRFPLFFGENSREEGKEFSLSEQEAC